MNRYLYELISIMFTIHITGCFIQIVSILHLTAIHVSDDIDYLVLCMLLANTLINPFLYILVRASIRKAYLHYGRMFVHKLCCPTCNQKGWYVSIYSFMISVCPYIFLDSANFICYTFVYIHTENDHGVSKCQTSKDFKLAPVNKSMCNCLS